MAGVENLCEAIILQSMEDVLTNTNQEDSMEFFTGEGMDICSSIIGLGSRERDKLMHFAFRNSNVARPVGTC